MKKVLKIFLLGILFSPKFIFAMQINEIMYDAPGTDTGHEWIEVYNNSQEEIDLINWRFFENSVAHELTLISGASKIPAGSYAIIASDASLFLSDYPDFSGTLFDSVFSLVNTGEVLALIDPNGNKIHEVSYTGDLGAKGDGNTLQLADGVFISAPANPGAQNATEPFIDNQDPATGSATSSISSHSSQQSVVEIKEKPELSVSIGRERLSSIHTPVRFEVERSDLKNAGTTRYFWNFGDGNTGKGKDISHSYKHEGIYNVILNAFSGSKKAVSRTIVHIKSPKISLNIEGEGLVVSNTDSIELNIGNWQLKTREDALTKFKFTFPQDTIISANNKILFDKEIFLEDTNLWQEVDSLSLFFPNEKLATKTPETLQ